MTLSKIIIKGNKLAPTPNTKLLISSFCSELILVIIPIHLKEVITLILKSKCLKSAVLGQWLLIYYNTGLWRMKIYICFDSLNFLFYLGMTRVTYWMPSVYFCCSWVGLGIYRTDRIRQHLQNKLLNWKVNSFLLKEFVLRIKYLDLPLHWLAILQVWGLTTGRAIFYTVPLELHQQMWELNIHSFNLFSQQWSTNYYR